ncbi:oligosaccharide flippase family protein [Stenotrophomonas maltophilia]|uniref:oligosaccharide flippase family protein n=1 Tax=Stenotrophomonas maltophilia TaxID=40324 RepID=UPI0018D28398|nr:oligosaccharide flippase family protein [Stenotrophomonas maltophilia]MBH1817203.1 oligosaccharide flippase family protein [Stenotrophomonas maltophilia]MCU1027717.1 oligosaccharide flippase family protein [Stenotrophomonas maltophilia]
MNLRRNSLFSAAEVLIGGIGLFLIYRSVVAELGIAMLGVWSIVLATTAFGRVADVGISAGLSRFIAAARGRQEHIKVSLYFWTALSTIAILMAVIAVLGWLPLNAALGFALSGVELTAAQQLLPWALFTFWLLNINAGLAATLLGIQRSDLRAVSSIGGMIIQVAASYLLVKSHGLLGLAWAQAAQYLFTIAASSIFAHRSRAILGPPRFSALVLKELFGFGAKLQIGTIANLLFEPLSKLVLGAVAGPVPVGIFEMAYRMVYQIRTVAIMALQNLVPAFAELSQRDSTASNALFTKSNRVAALAGGGLMIAAISVAPLVSVLWLQTYSSEFMLLAAMISVCWLINILCAPSYFWGIAHGTINANIGGQLLTGILSPALAYVLGNQYGPTAAVIGILAGKAIGDTLPAIFNRPAPAWSSAGIAQPWNLLALAATLLSATVAHHIWGRMAGDFLSSHDVLKLITSS